MRYAAFLPLFDELADPRVVARIATEAEQAGWDGVFVWDHITYRAPVQAVADPWVSLAAVACATERVRIGPLVTPLPRRRPVKLAREIASLDQLAQGRVTLGVGIGGDGSGELSSTGEQLEDRVRAVMLDEGLEVLRAAWTGERVDHRGEHYLVDGLTLRPTPVQRPGPPVWVAVRYGNRAPLRRAARHEGVVPVDLDRPDQLAEIVEGVRGLRDPALPAVDVAVGGLPGTDPRPFAEVGATWWLTEFGAFDLRAARVSAVLRDGPPA
ncbi:MAG TPA: LLM class flavin-dependent oxidoreductase [Mycobacteriales bacterium]|jgi:alkanesulfonate monooxygenase SsuD/methylene tetrahydromethanopterin reductase-like flavin-dependent oxidoreductase (luciferase family)|nr:LLM class flavin-dependent oxidoreductase [Mycobacteriales bacterium]